MVFVMGSQRRGACQIIPGKQRKKNNLDKIFILYSLKYFYAL